ncbi:chymotrypsinogen A-like [Cheilinus undulatus]|uniref:chymotrypsinogen A-like n=1 Tax=Cheilinus undulatus TaxID=241271 RepID=UPI001BD45C1C|nr:chymotrypsinogen A-like [Cheilinus undulatus]
MAFYKILCGVTLMLLFTPDAGCQAEMQECGKLSESHPEHLPWQVVISFDNGHCLGSLINNQWVVTDGHCGDGIYYYATIYLGCTNTSDPKNNCKESREVDEAKCTKPTANSQITRDSICLLQMYPPVNFTDLISPVCILAKESIIHSGTESWVATGSYPNPLLKVPVVRNNECKCFLPKVKDHMICAGHQDQHWLDDNCLVNIGGGLLVNQRNYWTLIGVVRLDPTCSELDGLKTYSSVAPFSEYILNATYHDNQLTFVSINSMGTDPDANFVCPHPSEPPIAPTAQPPEPPMQPKPQPPCTNHPAPPCPKPEGGCRVDSVFDSGVSMMPSSPFVLLCVLVLSLCGIYW